MRHPVHPLTLLAAVIHQTTPAAAVEPLVRIGPPNATAAAPLLRKLAVDHMDVRELCRYRDLARHAVVHALIDRDGEAVALGIRMMCERSANEK